MLGGYATLAILVALLATSSEAQRQRAARIRYGLQEQRPPVARVNEPWSFQLLPGTFYSPTSSPFSYNATAMPAWASFDASTQTFSGTPLLTDVGNTYVFVHALSANNEAVQDAFHLLVSSNPAPIVSLPIADQLPSASTMPEGCVLHYDQSLRIIPGWTFSINFQPDTYTDAQGTPIYYTAYSNGTTSLPDWLEFDNTTCSFEGTAPAALRSGASSTYPIELFGSDVYGYGDVRQTFTLRIESHSFDLLQPLPQINATLNGPVNYSIPTAAFEIDHVPVVPSNISAIAVDLSAYPFLTYVPATRSIGGRLPASPFNSSAPVALNFTSSYGNVLTTSLDLAVMAGLFTADELPAIMVQPDQPFSADISPYASDREAQYMATLDPISASSWVHFDSDTLLISGTAPNPAPSYGNVTVTLAAFDNTTGIADTSKFVVAYAAANVDGSTSGSTDLNHAGGGHGLSHRAVIVLATVVGCLGSIALLLLLIFCCRRSFAKKEQQAREASTEKERDEVDGVMVPSAYSKEQKGKGRATSEDAEDLDQLAAIYTGRKPSTHQQSTSSRGEPEPQPRRFDLMKMFGGRLGSRQSGLTSNQSLGSNRQLGSTDQLTPSASQSVVMMANTQPTYRPASDGSEFGSDIERDLSSWGSKGSSSLFYSDTDSPKRPVPIVTTASPSAPRQRRDFMRKPPPPQIRVDSRNSNSDPHRPITPTPFSESRSPSPIPLPRDNSGIRIVASSSQGSGLIATGASMPDALGFTAMSPHEEEPASPLRPGQSGAMYVDSPRPTVKPRLVPFTSERLVANYKRESQPRTVSQPTVTEDGSSDGEGDATADAREDNRMSAMSVPYMPPAPEDPDAIGRSPIFFSTPRDNWQSPALGGASSRPDDAYVRSMLPWALC